MKPLPPKKSRPILIFLFLPLIILIVVEVYLFWPRTPRNTAQESAATSSVPLNERILQRLEDKDTESVNISENQAREFASPSKKELLQSVSQYVKKEVASTVTISKKEEFQGLLYLGFKNTQDLEDWDHHKFNGKTQYALKFDEEETYLEGVSEDASSGLIFKMDIPKEEEPWVSWEWRVHEFPSLPDVSFGSKTRDDFAARIYVLFQGLTPFTRDIIQYVWDPTVQEDSAVTSEYLKRIKVLVVESGTDNVGKWVLERRNLIEDYRRLFGKEPKRDLSAIGIMVDTDNTDSRARADFRNVAILKRS